MISKGESDIVSAARPSDRGRDEAPAAGPLAARRRRSLVLPIVVGLVALLLAASYLARTRLVLGPLVERRIAALAKAHQADVHVAAMSPEGLWGVRLEGVHLVADRGPYTVRADLDALALTPSLEALVDGRVELREVAVRGGHVEVIRRAEQPDDPDPTEVEPSPAANERSEPAKGRAASAKRRAPAIQLSLHDVALQVRSPLLPVQPRPITVHRASLEVERARPRLGFALVRGYGLLPDGVPFAVRPADREEGEAPPRYLIEPERPTRLDRWTESAAGAPAWVPVVRVGGVTVCPACDPAVVEAEEVGVELAGVAGAAATGLRVPKLVARIGDRRLAVTAEAARLRVGGEATPVRLTDAELVRPADGGLTGRWTVVDADGGQLAVRLALTAGAEQARVRLDSTGFRPGGLWAAVPGSAHVSAERLDGRVVAEANRRLELAELSVRVGAEGLRIDHPVVASEPLVFEAVDAHVVAVAGVDPLTLSIAHGRLAFGEAAPIGFGGYLMDAGAGYAIEAFVRGRDLSPQALVGGLAPGLVRAAEGARFEGSFGFEVATTLHTAFPDSVTLDVGFSGEVATLADGPNADIRSLAADGPPSVEFPGPISTVVAPERWVAIDALPAHVPAVLMAAEDAHFLAHDGFSWEGLRRALVHNLAEGGIERGGSTLSQQLVKNLFLEPDRTLARKVQEAYVTWRLEAELDKRRILELYLNLVDWGPGIQGLRRAAERYFDRPPAELTVAQMALLSANLPAPSYFGGLVRDGWLPWSRLVKLEHILSNLRFLGDITSAEYARIYGEAQEGRVGGLALAVCSDGPDAPGDLPGCP